jgi:two-component system cell cycle response regulator
MDKKSHLLIVDDEERGREALKIILSSEENYQLSFATSGEEALKRASELMPDLVLLDVMMPGIDGFEVCKRLRVHPKLAEVPIIMLTAISDRKTRLSGIEAGADDFITKPFERMELLTRVRTITRLNRYRRLLAERVRFDWAVEQSNDGYLLLIEGNVIRYANSAARYYLGLLKDRSLAEGFLKHIEKQNFRTEPAAAWDNWPAPNVGSMPRYLVRPETAQSASLWLQVDTLESPSDAINGQLVHLRDVSEQMNLQQQMWSFQTLVSHKLRAPLNGLVGLQILEQNHIDLSGTKAQALLKMARESAKRLQDQILDILRYVDSSQLLQHNNTFLLTELSALLTKIQSELEIKTVLVKIADEIKNNSLVFPPQGLELVLRELFTNAKKFHPQQTPTIEVSVTSCDKNMICLTVTDDGQHLPNQEMAKVWTPYYQCEKYFTGEVKGMGLGLAMIARLVWGSGGSCGLHNREDKPGVLIELNSTAFGDQPYRMIKFFLMIVVALDMVRNQSIIIRWDCWNPMLLTKQLGFSN